MSGKRTNYLSWEDYFMATAILASHRSKDPCTQVGACIVNNDNIIVGVGYNGFPKGCSDDEFSWANRKHSPSDNKHFYVCHAEVNAILSNDCRDLKNCRMYVTLFPCHECAKFIIQSGIKKIFYLSDKHEKKDSTKASKRMFDAANVTYSRFIIEKKEIIIKFDENCSEENSQPSPPKILRKEKTNGSSE